MIVQCEQCQTRFKIPDEKVTDKGVKVRCTKCQHTFRVSRAPAGAATPAPAPVSSAPVEMGFDPFERFGTAPEPKPAQVTRPGFFAEGVEATSRPAPAPLPPSPWNTPDSGLEDDAFQETTRVQSLPLPPEARPPVPALPPMPFDLPPATKTPAPGKGLSPKTPAPGQGLSGRTPAPGQGVGRPGAAPLKPNVPAVQSMAAPAAKAAPGARPPAAAAPAARPGLKPPEASPAAQPAVPPATDLFAEFFAPGAGPAAPLPELPPNPPATPAPVPSAAVPPGGLNASFGFGDKGSFGSVDMDLSEPPPDLGPPPEFDPAPRFEPPPPAPAPKPVAAPVPVSKPISRPVPVPVPTSSAPAAARPAPIPVPTSSAPTARPMSTPVPTSSAPAARPAPAPASPISAFPFADEDPFGPSNADLSEPLPDLGAAPEPEPQFAAPAPAAPAPAFSFADEDPFGSVGGDLSGPSQDELSAPAPAPMLGRSGPMAAPPAPMAPAPQATLPRPKSSAPASFDEPPAPMAPAPSPGFNADFAPPGPMDFGMLGEEDLAGGPAPMAASAPAPSPFAPQASAQPDPFAPPEGGADPFAPPGGGMDPFAPPGGGPDPFAAPGGQPDPFAPPGGGQDPFAAAAQAAHADPFAAAAQAAHADPFAAAAAQAAPHADPFAAAEHGFNPTETGRQRLDTGGPGQPFLTQTDTSHKVISPTETGRHLLDFPPRPAQEQGSGFETAPEGGSRELIDLPAQPEPPPGPPPSNLAAPAITRPAGRPADMGIPERRKPSAAQRVTGQVAYLTIAAGLLLALTAVGGVYMKEGRVDASALSPATLLKLMTPSEFVARSVSNGLYDTQGGGSVFYVRGEVENRSTKPVRVKVLAALYDGGQRVKSAEGLAGALPNPEELYAVTNEEAATQLRTRLDAGASAVAPGKSTPFIVVFHEYPRELGQYRLEVTMEAVPEGGGKP